MNHLSIKEPSVIIQLNNWFLSGNNIVTSEKRLKHLTGVFSDKESFAVMNPETLIYNVQAHYPVPEGTEGGLFFGTSIIQPGKVGNEYFMTRGHYHAKEDRAEYYWGVLGEGMLIQMNKRGVTWAEKVFPGSLHYINGFTAHRLANTGNIPLTVGASWPSDAGHNYDEISDKGFSAILLEVDGKPELIMR